MTTLLQINASINDDNGQSSQLANQFVAAFRTRNPDAKIVVRNVEDHAENFTRFLLIRRDAVARPGSTCDKTSLVFATRNIPGALFRCLAAFALRDINLSKLESRPWRGRPFEYLFYLDFLGRPDRPPGRQALAHLAEYTSSVRVLGCYPRHRGQ